jgi:hypothetical protein
VPIELQQLILHQQLFLLVQPFLPLPFAMLEFFTALLDRKFVYLYLL